MSDLFLVGCAIVCCGIAIMGLSNAGIKLTEYICKLEERINKLEKNK